MRILVPETMMWKWKQLMTLCSVWNFTYRIVYSLFIIFRKVWDGPVSGEHCVTRVGINQCKIITFFVRYVLEEVSSSTPILLTIPLHFVYTTIVLIWNLPLYSLLGTKNELFCLSEVFLTFCVMWTHKTCLRGWIGQSDRFSCRAVRSKC